MAFIDKVMVGEAQVGDGHETAHVDLLIGPRNSAAEIAFCNTLTGHRKGVTNALAVVSPNLPCKPDTVLYNKLSRSEGDQAEKLLGPARRAVAMAVMDCVDDGTIPVEEVDDIYICVGVFIHSQARDDKRIEEFNHQATRIAIKRAVAGEPKAFEVLSKRDSAEHLIVAYS